jgi:hypothetical protein
MAQELGARLGERGPDGYTPAQRFFISYAQYYGTAERPTFARENLRDDPHAPSRYRVNGPLSNLPAFCRGVLVSRRRCDGAVGTVALRGVVARAAGLTRRWNGDDCRDLLHG